jgi:hypothetical protein
MTRSRPTVGQIHITVTATELWMAFVADPDDIPVGLMQEREADPIPTAGVSETE